MSVPVAIGAVVALLVIAELGRVLVARLFGYVPERHLIPFMKLPGMRGTTGFRLTLILAGPVAGYLAIAGLAFALFRCHGVASSEPATTIDRVVEGGAAAGKLAAGDVIVEVEGASFPGGAEALGARVNAKAGAPVSIAIDRAGTRQVFAVTPSQQGGRWLLGVQLAARRDTSTGGALRRAIVYPAVQAGQIGQGLIELVRGRDEPEAGLIGPIQLVEEFRNAYSMTTGERTLRTGMLVGTYALLGLALFDLIRALLLILFRS